MKEVIISNPEEFEKKKKAMKEGGVEKFHVVADFDRTLTKAFYKGAKASSIISYLRNKKGYLTKDYPERSHALFDKYHPIEVDPSIPMEEKNKKMTEWWEAHFNLLVEAGFNREVIERSTLDMISEDALAFREGVESFLNLLRDKKIPVVIMSSSVGDLIIEFMKQKEVYYPNTHITSNLMDFDESGKATGIKSIVHVFNKHEMVVDVSELIERKNVLLLGDSMGDLGMVDEKECNVLIRVAFLNENVEERLEIFKQNFDVVIIGDGDFSFVNELMEEILGE